MSQYPSEPQYGQPQYGGPGTPMPTQGTSGAAIASLVCGILGCIPLLTSIAAVILGIVGIQATGNSGRSGRGLAIAGLILGLIGIAGWGLFGGTMFWGYSKAKNVSQAQALPFLQAIVDGDYSKAGNYGVTPSTRMTELHDQIKDWGSVNMLSIRGFQADKTAGTPGRMVVTGRANFSVVGEKDVEISMDARQGQFKVVDVTFKESVGK